MVLEFYDGSLSAHKGTGWCALRYCISEEHGLRWLRPGQKNDTIPVTKMEVYFSLISRTKRGELDTAAGRRGLAAYSQVEHSASTTVG
jgi:hypothetical protein